MPSLSLILYVQSNGFFISLANWQYRPCEGITEQFTFHTHAPIAHRHASPQKPIPNRVNIGNNVFRFPYSTSDITRWSRVRERHVQIYQSGRFKLAEIEK